MEESPKGNPSSLVSDAKEKKNKFNTFKPTGMGKGELIEVKHLLTTSSLSSSCNEAWFPVVVLSLDSVV